MSLDSDRQRSIDCFNGCSSSNLYTHRDVCRRCVRLASWGMVSAGAGLGEEEEEEERTERSRRTDLRRRRS